MSKSIESKDIERILAEADELIQQINSDVIRDMKEANRLEFEIYTQNLEKLKSEFQDKIKKKGKSEIIFSAEGMHEAIQDILKAIKVLTSNLT